MGDWVGDEEVRKRGQGFVTLFRVRDWREVLRVGTGFGGFREVGGSFSVIIFDLGAGLEGSGRGGKGGTSGAVGWKSQTTVIPETARPSPEICGEEDGASLDGEIASSPESLFRRLESSIRL